MPYPWQMDQWKALWLARQQGRLPHALLLTGVRGLGKMRFAEELAQAVLCEKQAEQACRECRSCHFFSTEVHADYFPIVPQEKSKSLKVDQIRELIEAFQKTAQGDYQVAVIYPAEAMNRAAANALLKTLEEPSGNVLLILVCDQLGFLPATIMSRCQKIRFSCVESEETLTWLSCQLPTDLSPLQWLKMADYAPLHAITLYQEDYLTSRDQLLAHLSKIVFSAENPIAPVSDFLKNDLPTLLRAFISIIRDLLCLCLGLEISALVNSDRLVPLQTMMSAFSSASLLGLLDRVQQAQQRVSGVISVNTQLLLENLFLAWKESATLS